MVIVVGMITSALILGGAGIAAFFLMGSGGGGDSSAQKSVPKSGPLVTIEPFVINLADAGKPRYLRIGISLEVASKKEKKTIKENKGLIRVKNAYINHLSSLTTDQLRAKEDKKRLSKNLKKLAGEALPDKTILGVYYTEFMIQ